MKTGIPETIQRAKQSDLAVLTGVPQSQISYWLTGKRVPRYGPSLQKLADALEVDAIELIAECARRAARNRVSPSL